MNKLTAIVFAALFIVIAITQSLFIVDESEQAIVLRFGQPIGEIRQPGLNFRIPVIETVRIFDKRILSVDPKPESIAISSTKENSDKPENDANSIQEPLIVDTFMRYRITDPLQFMKTLRTYKDADERLRTNLSAAVRAELGKTTLPTLLSTERNNVMKAIAERMQEQITSGNYGIELIDIRIVRTDFSQKQLNSTIQSMRSALKEEATKTRAVGEGKAIKIRAEADREVTVLLAKADEKSQTIRGQGDQEATQIYANAFNKDPEFYKLWRSMQAYDKALANPDTRLLLSPDIEFFHNFKKGAGRNK